jgi:hypothetical protein
MNRAMTPAMIRDYVEAITPIVHRSPSTIVLVHPPKAAGSAFTATARSAGWATPTLEHFGSARGHCATCGPGCTNKALWNTSTEDIDRPGVLASVGHRSLDVAREVAGRLSAVSRDVRIVMPVRPAQPRLESLFRFIWRQAFAGGVETAVMSRRRRVLGPAIRLRRLQLAGRFFGGNSQGRRHQDLVRIQAAADAANYCSLEPSGLTLDAGRWLEVFSRHRIAPLRYWMRDICEFEDLSRSVQDGEVELVRVRDMDAACRRYFGRPALRTNVSIDAPRPEVVRAIEDAKDLFERFAQRDAAFEQLVA